MDPISFQREHFLNTPWLRRHLLAVLCSCHMLTDGCYAVSSARSGFVVDVATFPILHLKRSTYN